MVRFALLIGLVAVAAAVAAFVLLGDDERPSFAPLELDSDPFAWSAGREDELVARAAAGHSHVIYAKSPDGVLASARRVERYRPKIEEVAAGAGVDPDLVEAMIFLESAGRPEVMASDDVEGAAGLGQILAGTATGLLGMRVDVDASRKLTRAILRADRRGESERSRRLRARRRVIDVGVEEENALEGTGR